MQYNQKRQECKVEGHNCQFLPLIFPNLGHLVRYKPLKSMFFADICREKDILLLRKGTACEYRTQYVLKKP